MRDKHSNPIPSDPEKDPFTNLFIKTIPVKIEFIKGVAYSSDTLDNSHLKFHLSFNKMAYYTYGIHRYFFRKKGDKYIFNQKYKYVVRDLKNDNLNYDSSPSQH